MEPLSVANPWIASVYGARHRASVFIVLPAAIVALVIALYGGPAAFALWQSFSKPNPLADRVVYYALLFLPFYLLAGAFLIWEGRAPRSAKAGGARGLLLGIAVGGLLFMLTLLAAVLAGVLQPRVTAAPSGLPFGVVAMGALTIFEAYAEEFFFRGWLQPVLAAEFGLVPGLIVTAILFCAAHFIAQIPSLFPIVNMFLGGLLFGLMALRTGSLMAPFGMHATWNWLEQSVAGLTPNPGVDSLGSIFDLDLVGPASLSGGSDGLNGSLLATAVLAAAIAGFLFTGAEETSAPTAESARDHMQDRRHLTKKYRRQT